MDTIQLNESGVVFNREEHTYALDGKYLSGITDMLHRQLFPNEFDGVPTEMIEQAALYGTEVHLSIEAFDSSWTNDGTQEVADYIDICHNNALTHERSEYCVTDGANWASNIDKVFRRDDTTFDIADMKTYGTMTVDKREKAPTAVINAKLSLESSIRQTQREEGVLDAAVNTISKKVDSINEHIDQVLEDAPTKLQVTVTVCDADWQKMQGLHTQWLGEEKQMLVDQHKQQEVLWLKQSQRLTDIVKNNEGVWISTKLFYIVGSLSLLSIITIAIEIAFYVYFHWIQ